MRRRSLERIGHLLLPGQTILAEELGRDLEIFAAYQQARANDDLVVAHGRLVMVGVGGAVGAVVAVHRFAFVLHQKRGSVELRLR